MVSIICNLMKIISLFVHIMSMGLQHIIVTMHVAVISSIYQKQKKQLLQVSIVKTMPDSLHTAALLNFKYMTHYILKTTFVASCLVSCM